MRDMEVIGLKGQWFLLRLLSRMLLEFFFLISGSMTVFSQSGSQSSFAMLCPDYVTLYITFALYAGFVLLL